MRYIEKAEGQPDCVRDFLDFTDASRKIDSSLPPASYAGFGKPYKDDFWKILLKEQGGLCAYTGVEIDERLSERLPGKPRAHWYTPHIEHLKPQVLCEQGEDMDYHNMVGALEVRGAKTEHFGAVAKTSVLLPVLPTQPDCESRFSFDSDGTIHGDDDEAKKAIEILRLDHPTLKVWRRGAIKAWLKYEIVNDNDLVEEIPFTDEELRANLQQISLLENDCCKEFCFAIASAIRKELGIA